MRKGIICLSLLAWRVFAQDATVEKSRRGFALQGLSIEAFGQYSFQPISAASSLTDFTLGGNGQTQLNFAGSKMDGYGAGGNIVLDFLPNVSLVVGVQYKSLGAKYQDFQDYSTGAASFVTQNLTSRISYKTWSVSMGPRFRLPLFGGEIFSGLGVGLILPFRHEFSFSADYLPGYQNYSYYNGVSVVTAPNVKSYLRSTIYNLGIVGVVELGYQFPILSRLSFAISLHVIYGTVSNLNKTADVSYTYTDGTTSKSTVYYKDSFTVATHTNTASVTAAYSYLNITDIGIRGALSFRMF